MLGQCYVNVPVYACTDLMFFERLRKPNEDNNEEKRGRSRSKGQKCTDRKPEGDARHATLKASEQPVLSGDVLGDLRGKGNGYRPAVTRIPATRLPLSAAGGGGGSYQEVP